MRDREGEKRKNGVIIGISKMILNINNNYIEEREKKMTKIKTQRQDAKQHAAATTAVNIITTATTTNIAAADTILMFPLTFERCRREATWAAARRGGGQGCAIRDRGAAKCCPPAAAAVAE